MTLLAASLMPVPPARAEPVALGRVATHTLLHQGRTRSYRLRVPKGDTKAKPM